MAKLVLSSLVQLVHFYKWAFGDLTASDSDIGVIGEFLVGDTLGCLESERKTQAIFDLVTREGVSVEVKTTTRTVPRVTKDPVYQWNVSDQRTALEGRRELADVWVFLAAKFPETRRMRPAASAQLSVFDPKYWTCWIVTGETVRASGCRKSVSQATFDRLGVTAQPFADFKKAFRQLTKERKAVNGNQE